MGLRIATNISSINAQRTMSLNTRDMNKSMTQLSTGSRITKAGDDAAGLAISEQLKAEIRSFGQATRNANDGISMMQTAEQSIGEVSNILTRMRELGIQASSDTVGEQERQFIQVETDALIAEIQRVAQSTEFGSRKLLDGTGGVYDIHVGTTAHAATDWVEFDAAATNITTDHLGISSLDLSEKEGAREALELLDNAHYMVNESRSNLGSLQNRLIATVGIITTMHESLSAANSRLRDADVAVSTSELAKSSVLLNGTTAVLSQANQMPQLAMRLIG